MRRGSSHTSQGHGQDMGSPVLPSGSCLEERSVRLRGAGHIARVLGISVAGLEVESRTDPWAPSAIPGLTIALRLRTRALDVQTDRST